MANTRSRSNFHDRGRSPRRLTQWFRSADVSALTSLAAGAAVLDQSLVGTEPFTIVRTRGIIWVKSDQSGATETPFGAVGQCVVSDQALAVGVSAVPAPITDKDSDLFMMHQYFAVGLTRLTSVGFDGSVLAGFAFDSKAMRKVPADSAAVWTVENASATAGLEYLLQFATLIKLA